MIHCFFIYFFLFLNIPAVQDYPLQNKVNAGQEFWDKRICSIGCIAKHELKTIGAYDVKIINVICLTIISRFSNFL